MPELQAIYGDGVTDPRVGALLDALESGGAVPEQTESVLQGCEVEGASQLLTRLVLEDAEAPTLAYAVSCAEAIRRGALRRELRRLQKQIEAMQQSGEGEIDALDARKMTLARELEMLKPSPTGPHH